MASLSAGCSAPRSFAQLSADAAEVPVPAGVTLVHQASSTNDGPGFSTTHSEEVTRTFANAMACTELQARWVDALRRAHRTFTVTPEPHLFGSSGQAEIVISDRPENLGVTLGGIDSDGTYTRCTSPFVWSFNSPH